MKSLFLTITAVLLSLQLFAQPNEIGFNGGIGCSSKPYGALYQGSDRLFTPAFNLSFHHNYKERWQVGLDVGMSSWQRNDNWHLVGPDNEDLGYKTVMFQAARNAMSFAVQLNHCMPIYSQYEDLARALFYFGAAAGPMVIGNDGSVEYSKMNPNTPSEYVYTAAYHFQPGYGFMLGGQVGFNYYVSPRIGINIQVTPTISWVKTNDWRMGGNNNEFHVYNCTRTIGVRYRL